MPPLSQNSSPVRGGRTFRTAAFFLVVIAAAQAVAAATALRRRHDSAPAAAVSAVQKAAPGAVVKSGENEDPFSPDAPPLADLSLSSTEPETAAETLQEPETGAQAVAAETVMARPRRPAPLDVPITDEVCLQHLDEGIYLKGKGDMQGALGQLRAALALQPGHPRLVFHLASALELMGLEAKARTQWQVLKKLGAGAGDYFEIAVFRLQGGEGEAKGAAAPPETAEESEKEGRLVFAGIDSRKAGDPGEGEVRKFRLNIERRQTEPVDVSKLSLAIHFFDEVNGRRIDRSTTVQPQVEWETAGAGFEAADDAVDWTQGSESGGFEYRQPLMSADDVVRFGRRKYLGYVVEMFYDGKLQDVSASVPQLLDFARELPVDDGAVSPEDAAAPVSAPGHPDNALFPGDFLSR